MRTKQIRIIVLVLGLVLLACTQGRSATHYWLFDEGEGLTTRDSGDMPHFTGVIDLGEENRAQIPVANDGDVRKWTQSGSIDVDTGSVYYNVSQRYYPLDLPSSFRRRSVVKFDISSLAGKQVEDATLTIRNDGATPGSGYVIVEHIDARGTDGIAAVDFDAAVLSRVGILNKGSDTVSMTSGTGYWEEIVIDPDLGPLPFINTHDAWASVFDWGNDISRAVFMFNSPHVIRGDHPSHCVKSAAMILPLDQSYTDIPGNNPPGVHGYAIELADKANGLLANITADDWSSPVHADLGTVLEPGLQPGGGTEYSVDVTQALQEFVEDSSRGSMFAARLHMEGESGVSQDPSVKWSYDFKYEPPVYDPRIEIELQQLDDSPGWYSIDITDQLQAAVDAGDTFVAFRLRLVTDGLIDTFPDATNFNFYFNSSDAPASENHPYMELPGTVTETWWSDDTPLSYAGNKSLSLDGLEDVVKTNFSVENWTAITAMGWIKVNDALPGPLIPDISLHTLMTTGSELDGFQIVEYGTNFFAMLRGAQAKAILTTVQPDTWYHVAMTWEATTATEGNLRIYVNGAINGAATTSVTEGSNFLTTTSPVGFGRPVDSGGWPLGGKLDELVIADYAMSASEIQAAYNNSLGPDTSTFTPIQVPSAPTPAVILQWQTQEGGVYQVYYNDDMNDTAGWAPCSPELLGTGGIVEWADQGGPGRANPSDGAVLKRFYAVVRTSL